MGKKEQAVKMLESVIDALKKDDVTFINGEISLDRKITATIHSDSYGEYQYVIRINFLAQVEQ